LLFPTFKYTRGPANQDPHLMNLYVKSHNLFRFNPHVLKLSLLLIMQVFVINIEGKSVPIDVDPDETVKTLKMKIEDKERIPVSYQCLVFNGKPLMDEQTLLDYKVQKDSNLRINLQAWDQSAYSASHVEPPVDWSKLATAAKEKVDQEVEEKKVLYEKLLRTKVETARNAKQVEADRVPTASRISGFVPNSGQLAKPSRKRPEILDTFGGQK
jgi:large subunit ribosomal protein L40e